MKFTRYCIYSLLLSLIVLSCELVGTVCEECHVLTTPTPPVIEEHDDFYFPIYSGTHQGEWDDCVACHPNPSNYAEFTCISCHQNPQTDDDHVSVNGYVFEENACLACHPTGSANDNFNHDNTIFPLTGAHVTVQCLACHANGYQGTPTDCWSCHSAEFNNSTNPNHLALGFSTDCVSCHTTEPDWSPASFDIHDNFWVLDGAHLVIANDCNTCHNGNYNNTPKTCEGCHISDFNATTDPDHQALQFSTDCESCHTTALGWTPSTFDHDGLFYPIYSGIHADKWDDCTDCHLNPSNYAEFNCIDCHAHNDPDTLANNHQGVNGYVYESTACYSCHPN